MLLKDTDAGWFMQCEGCGMRHLLPNYGGWTFNGNYNCPTFTPSFALTWDYVAKVAQKRCHFNITDGKVVFHGDCTHCLAGKTVPMAPLVDDDA